MCLHDEARPILGRNKLLTVNSVVSHGTQNRSGEPKMMERIREASPLFKARIAGVLYLIIFVAAAFAEFFVRGKLVVHSDAAATAHTDPGRSPGQRREIEMTNGRTEAVSTSETT
jgi:hypothetical protein